VNGPPSGQTPGENVENGANPGEQEDRRDGELDLMGDRRNVGHGLHCLAIKPAPHTTTKKHDSPLSPQGKS
jgi:hypothetical protein